MIGFEEIIFGTKRDFSRSFQNGFSIGVRHLFSSLFIDCPTLAHVEHPAFSLPIEITQSKCSTVLC